MPREEARGSVRGRLIGVALVVVALTAAAVAWRYTPLQAWLEPARLIELGTSLREDPLAPLYAVLAFVGGGLVLFPVMVLVGVTADRLRARSWARVYALIGATMSGAMTFAIGRHLSRQTVRRLAGRRLNDLSRRLGERGPPRDHIRARGAGRAVLDRQYRRWRVAHPLARLPARHGHRSRARRHGGIDLRRSGCRRDSRARYRHVRAGRRRGALRSSLSSGPLRESCARAPKRDANLRRECMAAESGHAPDGRIAGGNRDERCASRTWNIHGAVGADGRYAPTRIVDVLSELDADLVALQEVPLQARTTTFSPTWSTRPAITSPRDRCSSDAGPNSAMPCSRAMRSTSVAHVDLTVDGYEPRGALDVRIDVGARGPLRVLATHLGLRPGERREQVKRLLAAVEVEGPQPTILMGDLNEWYLWGRPLRWLHAHFREKPAAPPTFPARRPVFALDRIWISPAGCLRRLHCHASPLARVASDHLPLIAEVVV